MKRLLRWILVTVAAIGIVAVAFVAYVYVASARLMARTYVVDAPQVPIPTAPAAVARGKYLVEKVAACTTCHGLDFGGQIVEDNLAFGRLVSANLTRGRGGLPADYADQDFVRVLTHGVKRDGHSVIFMPTVDYVFTPEDLGAIIAYVKSVPPVDRTVPAMTPGPMARALGLFAGFPLASASMIDHSQRRLAAAPNLADPVAAGKYLVESAGCYGPPPGGANITAVGIGDWSQADFVTALRTHRRPNGSTIEETMPRSYGEMSDEDLGRVYAYLRTVRPAGEKTKNQKKTGR
jgi:mono/diheme cytochrome c family protein